MRSFIGVALVMVLVCAQSTIGHAQEKKTDAPKDSEARSKAFFEATHALPDSDGDGLSDSSEVNIFHTDPHKKDTDGDGLSDREEVEVYNTDPNNVDTDGDGLSDGDEVHKYKTSPRLWDSDGDGLNDGEEVLKYHTNPLNLDSDGDGLSDGDEVKTYHTDPLNRDTDGDTLTDGYEVNVSHTDPLRADTDGDGLNDNVDDCPLDAGPRDNHGCPQKISVGSRLEIPSIEFGSGKAEILEKAGSALHHVDSLLRFYPSIRISIEAHTDASGDSTDNSKLSLERADAIRTWLIKNGIDANRLQVRGWGQTRPVATNTTPEGRARNRRVELLVIDEY